MENDSLRTATRVCNIVFMVLHIVTFLILAFVYLGVSANAPSNVRNTYIAIGVIFLLFTALPSVFGGVSASYIYNYKKSIGMAVCNLLFVSLVSGILFIVWSAQTNNNSNVTVTTSDIENKQEENDNLVNNESEKIDLLTKYKKLLDDGVISQEEFDKKKADILK